MPLGVPSARAVTPFIFNSLGNIFEPIGSNIQVAIDDLPDEGGMINLPVKELTISDKVVVDKPVYIKGSGMTWQGTEGGTCIRTDGGLVDKNMFEFYNASGRFHFAGMSDLSLINYDGRNGIYVHGVADAHFRRVYINHGALNCIYIEGSEFDMWNLWITECLFENAGQGGVKVDPGDHDIIKTHILDNYFYACELGVCLQRDVEPGGKTSAFTIKGNHMYDITKTGIQLWKVADHIDVSDNILHNIGTATVNTYNGIRVGDGNVEADKCQ